VNNAFRVFAFGAACIAAGLVCVVANIVANILGAVRVRRSFAGFHFNFNLALT
jgi:hypothetical protein